MKYLKPGKYLGYDISEKAVEICTELYKNDPTKSFRLMDSFNNAKSELTMSLDVIFHLIELQTYSKYMKTLFQASNKYVIIYSSNTNDNKTSSVHVKHRKFTSWIKKNQKTFRLLEHISNKYPYDGDVLQTSFADFFIYEKLI